MSRTFRYVSILLITLFSLCPPALARDDLLQKVNAVSASGRLLDQGRGFPRAAQRASCEPSTADSQAQCMLTCWEQLARCKNDEGFIGSIMGTCSSAMDDCTKACGC